MLDSGIIVGRDARCLPVDQEALYTSCTNTIYILYYIIYVVMRQEGGLVCNQCPVSKCKMTAPINQSIERVPGDKLRSTIGKICSASHNIYIYIYGVYIF
jgi:hypothetical protein